MIARRKWLVIAFGAALAPTVAQAQGGGILLFAAASLKNALDEIATAWGRDTGKPPPRISYAASSALAKQIEQGAPADIFLSADLDWMDYVAARNLILPETRVNLLGNRIVLIGPGDSKVTVNLEAGVDLARVLTNALKGGRLAMANVDAVPAGKYGKAALETLGVWNGVKGSVAQAENVRAALLLVARGEAPLGIVYGTDAAAEPNVRIVATFPEGSHPPIVYPVARIRDSRSADAKSFLDHLRGAKARVVFEKQGFSMLVRSAAST
jgi:molybdate transport system substrate-binding protein